MQYDVATPDEYLAGLDDDWRREKLLALRRLVLAASSEIEEGIEYKMLSYAREGESLFHLNAQKNHVGLYTGNAAKVDPDGTLLAGLDVGKGCIRFKKTTPVDEEKLGAFLARAVEMTRDGGDIGC